MTARSAPRQHLELRRAELSGVPAMGNLGQERLPQKSDGPLASAVHFFTTSANQNMDAPTRSETQADARPSKSK
jgi:hypothetical protein